MPQLGSSIKAGRSEGEVRTWHSTGAIGGRRSSVVLGGQAQLHGWQSRAGMMGHRAVGRQQCIMPVLQDASPGKQGGTGRQVQPAPQCATLRLWATCL